MPLACDPSQTFDVSLRTDKQKDDKDRPVFQAKHLTGREFIRCADAMENLQDSGGYKQAYNMVYGLLKEFVKGWRNVPDPDNPGKCLAFVSSDDIDAVLTQNEMHELVYAIMAGARPGGDDMGKSDAQP